MSSISRRVERLPVRIVLLVLLSLVMVAVQGYHFGTDDGAIYIPAVEHVAHPQLFPFGQMFFLLHAHMSVFSPVVGGTARLLHASVDWTVLAYHLLGVFLLILAADRLAAVCFTTQRARWGGTLLLASVLPTQVAGTALPIMDAYLTARSLSTPLTVLAIAAFLADKRWSAAALLLATALVHPQMAMYGLGLVILLSLPRFGSSLAARPSPESALAAALPSGFHLGAAQDPYRETLYARSFFFAWSWPWYDWVGAIMPVLLLVAIGRLRRPFITPVVKRLCRALVILALLSTAVFLLFSASPVFDYFVRLQPMRSFHLIYIVMFVLLGGLAGEFLLRSSVWRWLVLFGAINVGMYVLDRSLYPASEHLELPGRATTNPWVQAFRWTREHTPEDAVFALPPRYLWLPAEDTHGFRALARRSMLADWVKDSGVASVFPQAAPEWAREQQLTHGWESWTAPQFASLATRSPVTWVVVERRQQPGLDCPYANTAVAVCRLTQPR